MQQARDICRDVHGAKKEADLYHTYSSDPDEYIYHACSVKSGGLLCKHCRTKSATIEMLQTRSADEGMTAFVVCSACGHRRHFG